MRSRLGMLERKLPRRQSELWMRWGVLGLHGGPMIRCVVRVEDNCRLCNASLSLEAVRYPLNGQVQTLQIPEEWFTFVAESPFGERTLRGVLCPECVNKLAKESE